MIDVEVHPEAEADHEDAFAWYFERNPQAATRFEAEFGCAIDFIRARPAMFPKCDADHHFVLFKRFPYRLIYRIADDKVQVIAIVHAKRRPDYWSSHS
ncbi:MAG: type II toxin-antitoxin system RelE/ParE family toxin [Planctomycetaceae bacterium]